jgi:curved DNA-binding protein CbpA
MKNPYQILGLDHRASYVDVEHQYHAVLTMHIAKHGARPLRKRDQQRLRAVRDAYLLLSSPSSRLAYDMDFRARENEAANRRRRMAGAAGIASLLLGAALLAGGVVHALASTAQSDSLSARPAHAAAHR